MERIVKTLIPYIFRISSLLLFCLTIISCQSNRRDIALHQALKFAGENRIELEKVLQHFAKDSLKLEAAKFLIRNMPFNYSYDYNALDKYYTDFYDVVTAYDISIEEVADSLEGVYEKIFFSTHTILNDAKSIHADYLIENINHAFMAWENSPWKSDVNFSEFCNEILPYRVGNETIEKWREPYYKKFQPILDSLLTKKDPVSACQILYDSIIKEKWIFVTDPGLPHRNALFLLDKRMGSCAEYSKFMTYVMRALGIPGGIDMIVQNPDSFYRAHFWNYVSDTKAKHIDYSLYEKKPDTNTIGPPNRIIGKVYRMNFELQKESLRYLYPELEIPGSLNSLFISDVSNKYIEGVDLIFNIDDIKIKNGEILYISVFNNKDWVPIDWTIVNNREVFFKNLEPGIVYSLTSYKNNVNKQIDFPVLIQKDKKIRKLIPSDNKHHISIKRKYPLRPHGYERRMVGGKFQASNNIQFDDAITLYTIPPTNSEPYDTISIETKEYPYIRYLSAPNGYCNMAEIAFFTEKNQKINGRILGTDGSFKNIKTRTKYSVFDNDPLTFFHAKESSGAWVGLELNYPQKITRIEYIFRNDDNYIRPGDQYELFYFSKNYIISLGVQTGTANKVLEFNKVPQGALLWLHNRTRGNEERIFIYENNEQIWW